MSDIHPLSELKPSSFKSEDPELDFESVKAIQNTLKVLSSFSSTTSFSPSNFTLLSSPSSSHHPTKETLSFLRVLLLSTTKSALSNSSSSFLAGPSSEADDYGDIAIYLCPTSSHPTPFSNGDESQILNLLGFSTDLLESDRVKVKEFKPPNLSSDEYASKLEDVYCFRVEDATKDGTVLFVLVGRYGDDWVGIVGVGVWS